MFNIFNYLENIRQYIGIEDYQNYLNTLSTVEKGALAHLLFAITVFLCTVSIAKNYFGDKLIIYLKIEEKYPRIAKIIRYRRIIIHYSIALDLIILLFLAVFVGYANLMVFLESTA